MEPDFAFPLLNLFSEVVYNTPDIKVITGFAVLVLLLFCSGLMSASEAAYLSLSSEDIEGFRNDSSKRAGYVIKLLEMPERLLSTILAGSIIVNVMIVLLSAFISAKLLDFSASPFTGFLLQAVTITFLILFFGEILPKRYASGNKLKLALFTSPVLIILEKIFRPLASLLIVSSSFIKRKTAAKRSNITRDDRPGALDLASSSDLDEDEKILRGILSFGNLDVSAVMCPSIDVTAIESSSSFSEVLKVITESGFSRIPVYSESFDDVKGILYAKDLLPWFSNQEGFMWQTLIRAPYFVPETKKINDLLKEFQINKIHMAIVVDEYGGTSGIITLEDILEEIVGEITDESDEERPVYRKTGENTYIFEGKTLLIDFIKVLGLESDPFDFVKGESETLAGLIIELTGEIPLKNKTIKYGNFTFMIESADRRRIKEIRVEINRGDAQTEQV